MSAMKKPKILVLLKLDEKAAFVLQSAKELSQKLNGKLYILHVKAPGEAIKRENQLSAKKELYEDQRAMQKQLDELLKEVGLPKSYDFRYGNIKNVALETIDAVKPQVIIMGKRNPKLLGLLGDSLIDTVLKNPSASVYLVNAHKAVKAAKKPTVGVFNGGQNSDYGMFKGIVENDTHEIKYLSIDKKAANTPTDSQNHFVFTANANALKHLVAFASKMDTQLFCVPKGMDENFP
ncbi:MAG: universal stress protein, partial [Croceitalea sp.]|nr:universal stress protein [Croceitalea sp.]